MRKIIDGLAYDTGKAEKVAEYVRKAPVVSGPPGIQHLNAIGQALSPQFEEALYRTKKNNFFIHGQGNAWSSWEGVEGIRVLDEPKARAWVEKYAPAKYEEIFGQVEEA